MREWEHGGSTDVANGAGFCVPWHLKIHLEGWAVRLAANGHPELIPPSWIDPDQRPRQHCRYLVNALGGRSGRPVWPGKRTPPQRPDRR